MTQLLALKIISIILTLLTAIIGGFYPFFKKVRQGSLDFPLGQALASGIFLGAGLIHMLGDSAAQFSALHIAYPFAFLIAGATFLLFLLLEHWGREVYEHQGTNSVRFVIIALVMLSIHSIFAGTALGLGETRSLVIILLIAILAHKWAASFAIAVQIASSRLQHKLGILLFLLFVIMTPLGILLGTAVANTLQDKPLIEPIFNALAAGTFLYLGTLHGLSRSFMIDKCCNLKNFSFVVLGFILMALVAVWT
jgi:hypothetical protein